MPGGNQAYALQLLSLCTLEPVLRNKRSLSPTTREGLRAAAENLAPHGRPNAEKTNEAGSFHTHRGGLQDSGEQISSIFFHHHPSRPKGWRREKAFSTC